MSTPTLLTRHTDLTQELILRSAIGLLERAPLSELSVRSVAREAGISERTVFRYFATRSALLDALALAVSRRIAVPPAPDDLASLLAYPGALYARFESERELARAVLFSELYPRIRQNAQNRAALHRALIDKLAPRRPERERRLVAANVSYHLVATTWHYYRFNFGFSLEDSVTCARLAIVQALEGLGVKTGAKRSIG
jgi:AcrR family transcriptional regulator